MRHIHRGTNACTRTTRTSIVMSITYKESVVLKTYFRR